MKLVFFKVSVKSDIFYESQDDQFRHLSLKQITGELGLSADGNGEGLDFHSSQGILCHLSTKYLIDQIDDRGSRFEFSHPQDHALNGHFPGTPGSFHNVELRSGTIESLTNVYSVGETFLLLKQIQI
jgi:hypothetical protein